MDDFDKQLLNRLQSDFPMVPEPFRAIAEELGVAEDDVIAAIRRLKDEGIIRRFGGVFSSRDLGFYSTLMAAQVAPDCLEEVAAAVSAYGEVTHNYEREHHYNLWFTLTATSRERVAEIAEEIRRKTGVGEIHELPAVEFFKVDVKFSM